MSRYTHADYLDLMIPITKLRESVNRAAEVLKKLEFDALAFSGMSGALITPALALALDKPFIMVRKKNDGSHSDYPVEGCADAKTYIIIDDLVASGDTARRIVEEIAEFSPKAKCLGLLRINHLMKYNDDKLVKSFPSFSGDVEV